MTLSLLKVGVLISGRGSNLKALLDYQSKNRCHFEVSVVLSDKAEAAGLKYAEERGIPTVVVSRRPKSLTSEAFNAELVESLKPFAPELIVLAGFMRIIGANFLEAFSGNVVNIHPSLLPLFPGADGQAQAVAAKVLESGCTVHYVVPEVDAGPTIAQCRVPVLPEDTVDTLSARILQQEHQVLPAVVEAIAQGAVTQGQDGGVIFADSVKDTPLGKFL